MIGSELAQKPEYLLSRAQEELNVDSRLGKLAMRFAPMYISLFGVPEVGVHVRIAHALGALRGRVGSVVDLGCGAGFLIGALQRRGQASSVSGVDLDAASVAVARDTHPYAQIEQGNLLDYKGGPFDVAISIDVLEHMADADVPRFFQKAHDLLKPGGRLIVHTPAMGQRRFFSAFAHWEHHDHEREGFVPAELQALATRQGFRIERCQPTFGGIAALCWEINMLSAGRVWQSIAFPILNLIAIAADRYSRVGNGILLVAVRDDMSTASP